MAHLNNLKIFFNSTKYHNRSHLWKCFQFEPSVKCNKMFSCSAILRYNDFISNPNIKTFKHQHITLISLNRPDNKNRLNSETMSDLKKAISNFENDSSSTISILYGEGGSFCNGLEPEELVNSSQIYNDFLQSYCQKPIIAAVSGFAYDIGFDLCLWCDMRIIEENAVMAIDRKSDISKPELFLKRLITTVGYSRAMDLLLTGRDLNSKEAFECGLANRIVACGSSVGQAVNMAFNIGKFPQQSINHDRSVMHNIILK